MISGVEKQKVSCLSNTPFHGVLIIEGFLEWCPLDYNMPIVTLPTLVAPSPPPQYSL